MKALLRIVLIVVGLGLLILSVVALVCPWECIVANYLNWFSLILPSAVVSPITVYMFRAMCITYAWAGFLFLLGVTNPLKYLALIRVLALASVCTGLTCILVGSKLDLPPLVYWSDGVSCLVAGILIWTLSIPLGREPGQQAQRSGESTA